MLIDRIAHLTTLAAIAAGATACGPSLSSPAQGAGANEEDAGIDSGLGGFDAASGTGNVGDGSASGAVDSGRSDARSDGSTSRGDAAAGSDGGAVWQPSSSAPIHFHWMIGASSFKSGDILSGQNGQAVYDIDGANSTAADVAAIHAAGGIAVCYVDVGSLEQGRPDYADFPSSVVGPGVMDWPGENWLLVTAANQSTLLSLMKARFTNWCQAKGFDAIEPDNLDAWENITDVSEADNVAYDLAIGQLAHALPLSIGLKNVMTDLDASQYPSFLARFDWALNEQCYEYNECSSYTAPGSFLPAGKAVFDVEYNVAPDCTDADSAHINAQETDLDLVGATDTGYTYTPCIPDSQATW